MESECRFGHRGLMQRLQAALVDVLIALDVATRRVRSRCAAGDRAPALQAAPPLHLLRSRHACNLGCAAD